MRWLRRVRLSAAPVVAAAVLACPALGQPVSEPALKAAFLYNFAKFTAWPADTLAPGLPLALCVVGDGAIAGTLAQIAKGHAVDGREVRVYQLSRDANLRNCHVLYLPGDDAQFASEIVDSLKTAPVFTVADGKTAVQAGVVAGLFVENGRMRFAINVNAAQRARLHISSKVLALGLIVKADAKDDEHVAR
jgi:hypothetical protein